MGRNLTQRLIDRHLVGGHPIPGEEIGLRIDQVLTHDSTGTMVMLELEAIGLDRARPELTVAYVDHNLLQTDNRNAEDHEFLRSAARHYGMWFSKAGNGISHPTHMQRFGRPGATLVGSDSHTPAAGALGMLGIGLGGIEVAMAIAGEPVYLEMPSIWGVHVTGSLPPWVSAKDVILEMLRRHGVKGAVNRILEYHGPGLAGLTAMDRHVIANMGAELGATSTVFPADAQVRAFLAAEGREDAFIELLPDADAMYDMVEEIDLSTLEPLIALPGSPGNVVPVREVAGRDVAQVVVGSSANPGFRDVAVVAAVLDGRQAHPGVSLDINPASRQILQNMASAGVTASLVASGARLHQTGCLGCIGMGQAPAAGSISLRTFPRNFRGRSGTPDDAVYLCSPETAAAAALTGRITDPRDLPEAWGITYPTIDEPARSVINTAMFEPPLPIDEAAAVPIVKGSNIVDLPPFEPLADRIEAPVGLVAGHDVSTDEILPPGDQVLPFRSNIPRLADYVFARIDEGYVERVRATRQSVGHVIVAGSNYGQGSSREHAVLAPRYLGLKAVIAVSFARIHWQNLTSFGVLPLEFIDPASYAAIAPGDVLRLTDLRRQVLERAPIEVVNLTSGQTCDVRHRLSDRQIEVILAGGLIPWLRAARLADPSAHADTPGSA